MPAEALAGAVLDVPPVAPLLTAPARGVLERPPYTALARMAEVGLCRALAGRLWPAALPGRLAYVLDMPGWSGNDHELGSVLHSAHL